MWSETLGTWPELSLKHFILLERDVLELKSGNAGVEQRARSDLGMIREGEVFYQVVDDKPAAKPDAKGQGDSQ